MACSFDAIKKTAVAGGVDADGSSIGRNDIELLYLVNCQAKGPSWAMAYDKLLKMTTSTGANTSQIECGAWIDVEFEDALCECRRWEEE